MSERRRFNASERAALYLAADGHCTECGRELEPGWHADHMKPHSRGGPTDVINGQALCPTCNLRKGARVTNLRQWQREAIDKFHQHAERDFLVSATPGAGKTAFALTLAKQLIESGRVERIAVVVPTDPLRQQWADTAGRMGLALMPVSDATDYDKSGYEGYVATYAQIARGAGADLARHASRRPTLAVLDEIHHAGKSRSWGDGLSGAFEHAVSRLALTGTPWRQNKYEPIPFVTYGPDGEVQVNYPYEYGAAVADDVCRSIEFHAYDGEARWHDCGKARSAQLGEDMDEDDVPIALEAALRPDHDWMPTLLAKAAADLDELRQTIPDAGGLVVAHEQRHARAYAEILTRLTGEEPTVAVSEDADAKGRIDAFREAHSRWLVAVRMVSEGVDIPRLAVGVYATRICTPLFFRQVVGRLVRVRPGEIENPFNARLFIPAVPVLMDHARQIEDELRHQLEIERLRDEREREGASDQLPLREPIGASEAVFDSAIYHGDALTPDEHALAEERCRTFGIPLNLAPNIARMLRQQPAPVAVAEPQRVQIPRHRLEKSLRQEVDRLAGKYSYRAGIDKKDVNYRIRQAGFPPRKKCSIDELERLRDYLAEALGELR